MPQAARLLPQAVPPPAPQSRRIQNIEPKNGHHPVLMIAGGPADRARELRDLFAKRRGALVKYHLDYEKPLAFDRPVPPDVDLVIVLKSMVGHSNAGRFKAHCEAAGVPVVVTSHKWTIMDSALRQRVKLPKAPPLPVNVTSTAFLRTEEDLAEPEKKTETPAVEATPPPPPAEDPAITAARIEAAKKDTVALIRELQYRLAGMGMTGVLIDLTTITFSTGHLNAQETASATATH